MSDPDVKALETIVKFSDFFTSDIGHPKSDIKSI
jgi:hypothetical protein